MNVPPTLVATARLARATPLRTAIVAVSVGGAVAGAVIEPWLSFATLPFAFAVVAVARRSLRPELATTLDAWRHAGATKRSCWLLATLDTLLVAGTAAVFGIAGGLLVRVGARSEPASADAWLTFAGFTIASIGLPALLHRRPSVRPISRSSRRGLAVARGIAIAWSVGWIGSVATGLETDFTVFFGGGFILVAMTAVVSLVAGPVLRRAVVLLDGVSRLRPVATIAARRTTRGSVIVVVSAATSIVAGTSVFGASVERRPTRFAALETWREEAASLPNDIVIFRDSSPIAEGVLESIRDVLPGAIEIPLFHPFAESDDCPSCAMVVLEEPRLRAVYGRDADVVLRASELAEQPRLEGLELRTRIASDAEVLALIDRGERLPRFSFADDRYLEVSRSQLSFATIARAEARSAIVVAPRPITEAQRLALHKVALSLDPIQEFDRGLSLSFFGGAPDSPESLIDTPWAATNDADRWSLLVASGALALALLLISVAIETLDRRRDAQRLLRCGATPGQLRAASALQVGLVLAVTSVVASALAMWAVRTGVHDYNAKGPDSPIPFVVPWASLVALTVGLPALGAALAASLTRPGEAV